MIQGERKSPMQGAFPNNFLAPSSSAYTVELASADPFGPRNSMAFLRVRIVAALFGSFIFAPAAGEGAGDGATPSAPNITTLPNNAAGQQVRLGRALVAKTYAHIGPFVADPGSATPAMILPAAIAISKRAPKISACRWSASTMIFRAIAPARARTSRSKIVSIPA